ncbi:MAG: isoamylase early set domain-containing protein [Sporichthyaceae bacterium]
MITREITAGGDLVQVRLSIAQTAAPDGPVSVVGDFNGWDPHANPLAAADSCGLRCAALTVPGGRRYRFRYLAGDDRWFNDEAADDYESNEFGGQDGVLDLTLPVPQAPPAHAPDTAKEPSTAKPRKKATASAGAGAKR